MFTEANQLNSQEVDNRLNLASPVVAAELYSLGAVMLAEIDRRFEYLDSKANKIAGYSGAIVALVVSTIGTWPKAIDPCLVPVVLTAALTALIAGGMALAATFTMEL